MQHWQPIGGKIRLGTRLEHHLDLVIATDSSRGSGCGSVEENPTERDQFLDLAARTPAEARLKPQIQAVSLLLSDPEAGRLWRSGEISAWGEYHFHNF